MFVLNSDITIGRFVAVKPHEVKVNKSLYDYVDKAVIKLPITSRIVQAGKVITQSVETAKQFTEGDKVVVKLGYNGLLRTEFMGFISRINFTAPLEVECEGYSYLLRKRTYKRTFVKVQLLDVLKYLADGTDITIDEKNIPAFIIDKLVLEDHSGTEVLDLINKISQNTIHANFNGNLLYAGLVLIDTQQNVKRTPDVKYRMGWNVVKDSNLKLRQAKNQNVVVRFLGLTKSGEIKKAEKGFELPVKSKVKAVGKSGKDGETKVLKTHAVTDQETLNAMANEMHTSLSYNGYEGKITAFLQPYCKPGDRAQLEDLRYPERSGTYLVTSTEVTYGTSGARRSVEIGIKL